MHPFSRITEFQSESGYFEMTIGTLVRGVNFVCETSQVSCLYIHFLHFFQKNTMHMILQISLFIPVNEAVI